MLVFIYLKITEFRRIFMKILRIMALLALSILLVLACVSCGDGNNTTTTTTTTTTSGEKPVDPCPKGEHTVTEWTVTQESTCKRKGEHTGICDVCGESVTEPMNLIDHAWSEEMTTESTCIENGEIYQECTMCGEHYQIEELDLTSHDYTVKEDVTGKYEKYECSVCSTNYVRNKATDKDLFYWSADEAETPGFTLETDKVASYYDKDLGYNVSGQKDTQEGYSMWTIKDDNSVLKNEECFIIQFDIMYDQYPDKTQSLISVPRDTGGDDGAYGILLYFTPEGYLGMVGEETYRHPIIGGKLELNTWYNIAVIVRIGDVYKNTVDMWHDKGYPWITEEDPFYRIPYEVYLNGEKLELSAEVSVKDPVTGEDIENIFTGEKETHIKTFEYGGADWGKKPTSEYNTWAVRISDGGGDNNRTYKMAIDNVRIYSGDEVEAPVRGDIDFGDGDVVTITFPETIDWSKVPIE